MPPPLDSFPPPLSQNAAGRTDLVVESIFFAIVCVSIGFRLWSRRLQHVQLQANDILILIAFTILGARYVLEVILILKFGLGLHVDEIKAIQGQEPVVLFRKLVLTIDLLWLTIVALIKISILHFYLTIFRQKTFMRVTYAILVVAVCFWCGSFFGELFFCRPTAKLWYPEIPGQCGDLVADYIAGASIDLIIDTVIILLPMPTLWSLQLAIFKKLALTFIFGVGFIIIAITSTRLRFFPVIEDDITYSYSQFALLSSLVPLLGILNANLPITPPAIKKIFNATVASNTLRKLDNTRSTTNRFERLSEPGLPLVHLAQDRTQATDDAGQIRVTRDWEVYSAPASNAHLA
ncbi:hypothetical protein GGR54DRAFT_654536 [Hypoxylon sp. NC1633]|nr:hypothetical protein GGR54DRAFT_654536 [Hypoxylon sp. NC1633]